MSCPSAIGLKRPGTAVAAIWALSSSCRRARRCSLLIRLMRS
jgi:hypothetical protein